MPHYHLEKNNDRDSAFHTHLGGGGAITSRLETSQKGPVVIAGRTRRRDMRDEFGYRDVFASKRDRD